MRPPNSAQAWLLNATLRENILFYNQYDEKKYQEIIKICELEDDIKVLPGKDLVEIGERGINLSGGQKQRIAIAVIAPRIQFHKSAHSLNSAGGLKISFIQIRYHWWNGAFRKCCLSSMRGRGAYLTNR